ncbi:hypothetical protein AVEN_68128-1 [Araneus ventricosus]|uniref:Uncharacterized protein n=1 Tax=Araneus ventricosus TaxID=182803 RepID=A0A4Y2K6Z6_ARAVE|nr:hypothetical protein AVEN_68128-1 [Araneus ventricosus]
MSHQAARATGGSNLDFPSGGAYHRWLKLRCPIRRYRPPVAQTQMSHQTVCTTGGSNLDAPSSGAYHRCPNLDVPPGGKYHRWLKLRCPTRRQVPPVAQT